MDLDAVRARSGVFTLIEATVSVGSSIEHAQLLELIDTFGDPHRPGDGDDVPDIKGSLDPVTNKVNLEANQAIFLFELGMTNLSSAAADFQDLVVLVTLAKNVEQLSENQTQSQSSPPACLIRVVFFGGREGV